MTVRSLALYLDRPPQWVRGVAAAEDIRFTRIAKADVIAHADCLRIEEISRRAPRPKRRAKQAA